MARLLLYTAVILLSTGWSSSVSPKKVFKSSGSRGSSQPELVASGSGIRGNSHEDNDITVQQPQLDHLAELVSDPVRKQSFDDRWANLLGQLKNGNRIEWIVRSEEFYVDRMSVFEDSFSQLRHRDAISWKTKRIIVYFQGENVAGLGPTREWYAAITKDILTPNRHLFKLTADGTAYTIDPACSPDHQCVEYFQFVGRIIAYAVSQQWQSPFYLTPAVFKHLLGKSVDCDDLKEEQGQLYNSIKYIKETNMGDVNAAFGYTLTFSVEVPGLNGNVEVDLIPDGRRIPVTDGNKGKYLRLMCQMHMIGVKSHNEAFRHGFNDIIPQNLLTEFNEQELELLIRGIRNIDMEDLKKHTNYNLCNDATQIAWFWEAVGKFDQPQLAMLLRFVTGSPKPPINGFESLLDATGDRRKFTIYCTPGVDQLPTASTCSNQLKLPQYTSYDKLDHFLRMGIFYGHHGFM